MIFYSDNVCRTFFESNTGLKGVKLLRRENVKIYICRLEINKYAIWQLAALKLLRGKGRPAVKILLKQCLTFIHTR